MSGLQMRDDIQMLLSYGDDLVGLLKSKRDIANLMQYLEGAKTLRSYCDQDTSEIQNSLEEYKRKINECQQRISEAKREVLVDADLDLLQKELEEQLQREHSLQEELSLSNEINDLEDQRISIEERKKQIKKVESDELKEQRKLSMYASVTNIIPTLENEAGISGYIVERDRKIVEKFQFEQSKSPVEICNDLWKMISQ